METFMEHMPTILAALAKEREGRTMEEEIARTVGSLQVFFNKWVVEIMYVLYRKGTLRFNEIKKGLKGMSGRTLSARLHDLEAQGLVKRELFDEMPVRVEYSLTDEGRLAAELSVPLILYLRTIGVGRTKTPPKKAAEPKKETDGHSSKRAGRA